MSVLSSEQIRGLLDGPDPLVSGIADLEAQLQPNGIDLTLESISVFRGAGRLGRSNDDRVLPEADDLAFDADGYVYLAPGPYVARLNEAVSLPASLAAIAKPRSSLLRAGVAVHNAVWDAGYKGRSQALVVVYNPAGFTLARGARIVQMVFLTLDAPAQRLYDGRFQGEAIATSVRESG